MDKRFFLGWAATFVAWMAGSFVVHGLLLHGDYAALPTLFRPEADAQAYFPFLLGAHVLTAGAMVWIYRQGVTDRAWVGQGLRVCVNLPARPAVLSPCISGVRLSGAEIMSLENLIPRLTRALMRHPGALIP